MFPNICFRTSQLTHFSLFQDIISSFQGRLFTQVIRPTLGNRLVEISRIIGSIAAIAFSCIFVIGGAYWLFFKEHAQQRNHDRDLDLPISPKSRKTGLEEDKRSQDEKSQIDDSKARLTKEQSERSPDVLPFKKEPEVTPKVKTKPEQKVETKDQTEKSLEIFDLKKEPEVKDSSLKVQALLTVVDSVQKAQFKANLCSIFEMIFKLDLSLGSYLSQKSLPSQSLLNQIQQLEPFGDDSFKEYETIVVQLNDILEPYWSAFIRSPYHKNLQDPVSEMFKLVCKNLSFVIGGIAEKYFNEGKIEQSAAHAEKIRFNPDLKHAILLAIARRHLNQVKLEDAVSILKKISYCEERENLYAQIVKIYIKIKDYPAAWTIAKDMSYSKEKEALILEIATAYCRRGKKEDLQEAFKMAKSLLQSSERDAVILDIAKAFCRRGEKEDFQEAFEIAKSLLQSSERDDMILDIAKAFCRRGEKEDLQEAFKIAKSIPQSSKRDAVILDIAKAFCRRGKKEDLQEALEIAKSIPYSCEKEVVILDIAKAYYRKGEKEEAIKTAKSTPYSKERDLLIQQMNQGHAIS